MYIERKMMNKYKITL